jgi:Leucine-rich repeat (LRR) protein
MNLLNRDELFSIAIHLDLPDLLALCGTNKLIDNRLCVKDAIWNYKLNIDFPEYDKTGSRKLKDIYISLYKIRNFKNKLGLKDTIYDLYKSKSLNLLHHKLTSLPEEIDGFVNLKVLRLMDNRLKTLPKQIGNLRNLEELYLGYNKLQTLPEEIGDLFRLKILDLRNNSLKEFPKGILQLERLKKLYLSNSGNYVIPTEMKNKKFQDKDWILY